MRQPTIGIEIELPWQTILARVDEEAAQILACSQGFYSLGQSERLRVQQGFDLVDECYKDKVASVFGESIKEQHDGYTEFAFRPQADHEVLVEVADTLYQQGILIDDEHYPLHVTLGGLSSKHASWLILMVAELSGGTTQKRITEVGTWSQKGEAGIRQRGARELDLGATVAIEMRSLVATSFEQLGDTLEIAQSVGAVLLTDMYRGGQSLCWRGLKEYVLTTSEEKGIDARTRWKNPQRDPAPWISLGKAVADVDWSSRLRGDIVTILQG
ncbi:MAG: hypothetical protein U0520_03240 [Candidatus Saccharimonadales bacterium]